jgi:predicted transcriptional regulator
MQQTSLDAYHSILYSLSEKQKKVYDLLRIRPMSNADIAITLGWRINCVTPRVLELREKKLVYNYGDKIDESTGRRCMLWRSVG